MIPKCKDEGEFNALMRAVFRAQGLGAIHIREADSPGPSDLLVWSGSEILGWVELKIDGKPLEVSQVEFLRERDTESGNAYVFNLQRSVGRVFMLRSPNHVWTRHLEAMQVLDDQGALENVSWKNWFWRNKRTESRYR